MGSWREQTLIDASPERVWELVGDPRSYPRWVGNEVVEVTGIPTVEKGASFEQVTNTPLGMKKTTFQIDELEDLHHIRLHCTDTGWFSQWDLTEADGATFVDVEIGMDPVDDEARAFDAGEGKRWYRQVAQASIDGVKQALARESTRT